MCPSLQAVKDSKVRALLQQALRSCPVSVLTACALCGRCWVDHVNAARADAVAGAGWRAVAAQMQAAIRAATAEPDAAGTRLTDELHRALGGPLQYRGPPDIGCLNNRDYD